MDFGFDHRGLFGIAPLVEDAKDSAQAPNWQGLQARFAAMHALYQELLAPFLSDGAGGTFRDDGAAVLARQRQAACGVNRDASDNGKTRPAIGGAVAGDSDPATGDDHD